MPYGFNNDKSKANLSDQFVVVNDTGTLTVPADGNVNYSSNLTTEHGYSPSEYIPIAIIQFSTDQYINLALVEYQLATLSDRIVATVRVRNLSNNNVTANVTMKVLLIKK